MITPKDAPDSDGAISFIDYRIVEAPPPPPAVKRLYLDIARGCEGSHPAQWTECLLFFKRIERIAYAERCYLTAPEPPTWMEAPSRVVSALTELRDVMAGLNGDRPWYSVVVTLNPQHEIRFDFDWDHLPDFDVVPEPHLWHLEFTRYPRPDLQVHVQDWMDGSVPPERAAEVTQRLADLRAADAD